MRLNFNPILEATKTVSMSSNANPVIGDVAEYTITVENKGNVDVSNLNLNDTFVGLAGASIQLNGGPTFQSATSWIKRNYCKRDGSYLYCFFTVNQAAVDSGGFRNTVVVTGSNPGSSSADVIEASDDGIDDDGNLTNDPTDVVIGEVPKLKLPRPPLYRQRLQWCYLTW